jgi:nitrate reductase NapAB chaperone NapD
LLIGGLVISLEKEAAACETFVATLRAHPAIEVGDSHGNKIAIVVESASKYEANEIWEWLHQFPEVAAVNMAFASVETSDESSRTEPARSNASN